MSSRDLTKGVSKKRRSNQFNQALNIGALAIAKPEVKNFDLVATSTQVLASFGKWVTPILINGIPGGTTRTTRVGGSVSITKIQMRAMLNVTGSLAGPPARVVLVYDKSPNGVLPAITDIWAADDFNSPLNISNSERFMVISDTFVQQYADGSNAISGYAMNIFRKAPSPGYNQKFLNTNTGTIADILAGAVYLIWSPAAGSTATNATLSYYTRIRFTDQ